MRCASELKQLAERRQTWCEADCTDQVAATLHNDRPIFVWWLVQGIVRAPIILSGSISLLAAGLIALVWSHRYAGPLRVLSAGILRLKRLDFSAPVRVRKLDMHQDLIAEFAEMQAQLKGALESDRKKLEAASGRLRALAAQASEKKENREELESLAAELKTLSSRYQL